MARRTEGGLIVPIRKKGNGERTEDYRGISIMPSLYKIYVSILTERLKEEIERKEIVPENQTGFRKGKGTLDNIYIINYLINRQISEKKGKMVALFVDLKAAFDTVNREVLINTLRERGVRKELIDRVAQLGVETRSRVRIGKKRGGCF